MNVNELKAKLGVETLGFSYLRDEADQTQRAIDPTTNQPTKWTRNWNNDSRVQIVAHEDTVKAMQANPKMANLALMDKGMKTSPKSGKNYQLYVVVAYTEDDFSF